MKRSPEGLRLDAGSRMDEKRDSETADDDDEEITEEITVYARVVCSAGY